MEEERVGSDHMSRDQDQVNILNLVFAYLNPMLLKCAVELRLPDIIHAHGGSMTVSEIASAITPHPSTASVENLTRIMRMLVGMKVFAVDQGRRSDGGGTLYQLTPSSRWLVTSSNSSLAPIVSLETHPVMMSSWHCLSESIKHGGQAFKNAHGKDIWELAESDAEFNKLYNEGLACTNNGLMGPIIEGCGKVFAEIGSLVDVGGGTGAAVAQIVRSHPHIKGINFDQPHVVATAPYYEGVVHLGGDMLEHIPAADAFFIKFVLHTKSDEDCVKVLENCKKAMGDRKDGRVLIAEIVFDPESEDRLDEVGMVFDLAVMALMPGGKERTESEWKKLLENGGFYRYRIIKVPLLLSIIEAFPF